jgi:hypothetical protein
VVQAAAMNELIAYYQNNPAAYVEVMAGLESLFGKSHTSAFDQFANTFNTIGFAYSVGPSDNPDNPTRTSAGCRSRNS